MFKHLKRDIEAALKNDPAAKSKWEVFLTYPGVKALYHYRIAHAFYKRGHYLIARMISQRARRKTGIEIHPGAVIGEGIFIDHGSGVVIGETAEIGNDVTIYQGVTLGGTGKDVGKRHPTVGNGVTIGAGAKVLGNITIGDCTNIGAGSVVVDDVPQHSTVVGIPGRIVKQRVFVQGQLLHNRIPDPIKCELNRLKYELQELRSALGK